jgi:hypothetical protein
MNIFGRKIEEPVARVCARAYVNMNIFGRKIEEPSTTKKIFVAAEELVLETKVATILTSDSSQLPVQ